LPKTADKSLKNSRAAFDRDMKVSCNENSPDTFRGMRAEKDLRRLIRWDAELEAIQKKLE